MKKILLFLSLIFVVCLFGCGANGANKAEAGEDNLTVNFVKIENSKNLYYDDKTQIVYVKWKETIGTAGYGFLSLYYGDNGLPYKYDTQKKELVELKQARNFDNLDVN